MNNVISETIYDFNESVFEVKEEPKTPEKTEEQIQRTPSRFTSLLKPERADSIKGFSLKLQSSDSTPRSSIGGNNQEANSHGPSLFHQASSDARNRIVSLSIIVPQKEDIDPVAQTFIDKFHETANQKKFHVRASNFSHHVFICF